MSKAQLARLIDLPDDALQQVLDYARTLSKPAAAEHFTNLLGDAPAAVEFIAAFNASGPQPAAASAVAAPSLPEPVPRQQRQKKKKAMLHTPPARQVANHLAPPGAVYHKKDAEEYMGSGSGSGSGGSKKGSGKTTPQRGVSPAPPPPQQQQQQQQQPQKQRGGGGSLISDALAPKAKPKKTTTTNTPTATTTNKPVTVAKVSITGGTAMHGAATALSDLETAIRTLEVSTNPTLQKNKTDGDDVSSRRCNCVATRHPLQTAAPNCASCGKVICVKEGLGPCTFCGAALLSPDEVQAMISELRAERGRERMAADREAHQKVAGRGGRGGGRGGQGGPGAHMIAGQTKWGGDDAGFVSLQEAAAQQADEAQRDAAAKARAHRDRLLAFQSENAQRTTVRDEAADYDVGDALAASNGGGGYGRNQWATPAERAHKLRQQQKLLREMEWNARPEYEKRQQVLSIDVTGRKVFRKVVAIERPDFGDDDDDGDDDNDNVDDEYGVGRNGAVLTDADGNKGGGTGTGTSTGRFSNNPLLGKRIKPVYDAQGRAERERAAAREQRDKERRKQKRGKGKGKGKGKAGEGEEEGEEEEEEEPVLHLRGRADDPSAATRWRRVQDDVDNEAVILDGGLYGSAV